MNCFICLSISSWGTHFASMWCIPSFCDKSWQVTYDKLKATQTSWIVASWIFHEHWWCFASWRACGTFIIFSKCCVILDMLKPLVDLVLPITSAPKVCFNFWYVYHQLLEFKTKFNKKAPLLQVSHIGIHETPKHNLIKA